MLLRLALALAQNINKMCFEATTTSEGAKTAGRQRKRAGSMQPQKNRVTALQLCKEAQRVLRVDPGAETALLPGMTAATFQHPDMLSADLMKDILPDLVVAPLIGPSWDALDVALSLSGAGYDGMLLIVSPPLPRQAAVLREMQALCPTLDIRLMPLPDGAT